MKRIGLLALLSLLASCGNDIVVESQHEPVLNPVVIDKFSASLKKVTAGMTKTESEKGLRLSYKFDSTKDKIVGEPITVDNVTKYTVLKVKGDLIYTLEERTNSGVPNDAYPRVTMQSKAKIIRDLSIPLAKGVIISTTGDYLLISYQYNDVSAVELSGHVADTNVKFSSNQQIDLRDPRCSDATTVRYKHSVTQNRVTDFLGEFIESTSVKCEKPLTRDELKAIDLSYVRFCDHTKDSEEEEEYCDFTDLSALVK